MFNSEWPSSDEQSRPNETDHNSEIETSPMIEDAYKRREENRIKEEIKKYIGDINKLFGKRYNLSVLENKLPDIVISSVDSPAYVEKDENGQPLNVIEIKKEEDILDGEAIGEEISHFYRAQLRPDHEEILTDEFFGFLGRKLLYEATKNEDGKSDFFKRGEPNILREFLGTKKMVVEKLKNKKSRIRELAQEHDITESEDRKKQIMEEGRTLVEKREDLLKHYRGYEFASKVDLNEINDWQKLYSMPDQEIRKRFFTSNPDYFGLWQGGKRKT